MSLYRKFCYDWLHIKHKIHMIFCYDIYYSKVLCIFISEIEDLPNSVKKQLFDELLDANAQKGCTLLLDVNAAL